MEKQKKQKSKLTMKIMMSLSLLLFVSCKKDPPPILENHFRMEIEATDNYPAGNVYGLFAIGKKDFPEGIDTTDPEGESYIFLGDPGLIYLEREINYKALDTAGVYFWAYTSGSTDNFYSVEIYKNETSIFKSAGNNLTSEAVKIN